MNRRRLLQLIGAAILNRFFSLLPATPVDEEPPIATNLMAMYQQIYERCNCPQPTEWAVIMHPDIYGELVKELGEPPWRFEEDEG